MISPQLLIVIVYVEKQFLAVWLQSVIVYARCVVVILKLYTGILFDQYFL